MGAPFPFLSWEWHVTLLRLGTHRVQEQHWLGRSYPTVLPIVVGRTWGNGARTYGLLAALPGIGAALATVFVVWLLGQRERTSPVWLGGILLGVALVCFGMAWNLVVAGLALLATGCFATGTMTLLNATVQETTPNEVRGRVMSLYTWFAAGMPALGGWVFGTLMGFFPPPLGVVMGGITLTLVTLVVRLGTGLTNTDTSLARQLMPRSRKTLPSLPVQGMMQSGGDERTKQRRAESVAQIMEQHPHQGD